MKDSEKKNETTPILTAERLTEALGLANDLNELVLSSGDSLALEKLRLLKSLLSVSLRASIPRVEPCQGSRIENGADLVEDYHQDVVGSLYELACKLVTVDAETGDSEIEEIALRVEAALERINRYFDIKKRASEQEKSSGEE